MKDKIYICHISDLHFGIYENKAYSQVDPTFTLPYSLIEFISELPENKKPHFLIILFKLRNKFQKKHLIENFEKIDKTKSKYNLFSSSRPSSRGFMNGVEEKR